MANEGADKPKRGAWRHSAAPSQEMTEGHKQPIGIIRLKVPVLHRSNLPTAAIGESPTAKSVDARLCQSDPYCIHLTQLRYPSLIFVIRILSLDSSSGNACLRSANKI